MMTRDRRHQTQVEWPTQPLRCHNNFRTAVAKLHPGYPEPCLSIRLRRNGSLNAYGPTLNLLCPLVHPRLKDYPGTISSRRYRRDGIDEV